MYSKLKIAGHPVHPMLVGFPVTFYTSTLVAFIVYSTVGDPFWFRAAYALNIAGVVMAIVAALAGLVDFTGIPSNTDAKRHAVQHMSLNTFSLVLFAVNWYLNAGQWNSPAPVMRYAIILPVLGFLATLGAGFLGWMLVQTHHAGVQLSPEEEQCIRQTTEYRAPKKHAA